MFRCHRVAVEFGGRCLMGIPSLWVIILGGMGDIN